MTVPDRWGGQRRVQSEFAQLSGTSCTDLTIVPACSLEASSDPGD